MNTLTFHCPHCGEQLQTEVHVIGVSSDQVASDTHHELEPRIDVDPVPHVCMDGGLE